MRGALLADVTLAVDVFFVVGFAALVAGLYLTFGVGVTLICAGISAIAGAVLYERGIIRRGRNTDGSGS